MEDEVDCDFDGVHHDTERSGDHDSELSDDHDTGEDCIDDSDSDYSDESEEDRTDDSVSDYSDDPEAGDFVFPSRVRFVKGVGLVKSVVNAEMWKKARNRWIAKRRRQRLAVSKGREGLRSSTRNAEREARVEERKDARVEAGREPHVKACRVGRPSVTEEAGVVESGERVGVITDAGSFPLFLVEFRAHLEGVGVHVLNAASFSRVPNTSVLVKHLMRPGSVDVSRRWSTPGWLYSDLCMCSKYSPGFPADNRFARRALVKAIREGGPCERLFSDGYWNDRTPWVGWGGESIDMTPREQFIRSVLDDVQHPGEIVDEIMFRSDVSKHVFHNVLGLQKESWMSVSTKPRPKGKKRLSKKVSEVNDHISMVTRSLMKAFRCEGGVNIFSVLELDPYPHLNAVRTSDLCRFAPLELVERSLMMSVSSRKMDESSQRHVLPLTSWVSIVHRCISCESERDAAVSVLLLMGKFYEPCESAWEAALCAPDVSLRKHVLRVLVRSQGMWWGEMASYYNHLKLYYIELLNWERKAEEKGRRLCSMKKDEHDEEVRKLLHTKAGSLKSMRSAASQPTKKSRKGKSESLDDLIRVQVEELTNQKPIHPVPRVSFSIPDVPDSLINPDWWCAFGELGAFVRDEWSASVEPAVKKALSELEAAKCECVKYYVAREDPDDQVYTDRRDQCNRISAMDSVLYGTGADRRLRYDFRMHRKYLRDDNSVRSDVARSDLGEVVLSEGHLVDMSDVLQDRLGLEKFRFMDVIRFDRRYEAAIPRAPELIVGETLKQKVARFAVDELVFVDSHFGLYTDYGDLAVRNSVVSDEEGDELLEFQIRCILSSRKRLTRRDLKSWEEVALELERRASGFSTEGFDEDALTREDVDDLLALPVISWRLMHVLARRMGSWRPSEDAWGIAMVSWFVDPCFKVPFIPRKAHAEDIASHCFRYCEMYMPRYPNLDFGRERATISTWETCRCPLWTLSRMETASTVLHPMACALRGIACMPPGESKWCVEAEFNTRWYVTEDAWQACWIRFIMGCRWMPCRFEEIGFDPRQRFSEEHHLVLQTGAQEMVFDEDIKGVYSVYDALVAGRDAGRTVKVDYVTSVSWVLDSSRAAAFEESRTV